MFDKITKFMDEKLSTPMAKLAEQRHLRAIRDGIIATLPLIIISSMFMVIAFLPNSMPQEWTFTQFIMENQARILMPYRVSMYIMTLYAVFGIGYSLSVSYDLDGLTGGILSELAFMLTIIPKSMPVITESITNLASSNQELSNYISDLPQGFVLPMGSLGSSGMFIGILVSFFAVEIYRFTQKSGFKISMPEQVPSSVARSFEALTPTAIVLIVISIITMFIGIDLHKIISNLVSPLIKATDTLPSVIIVIVLSQFFWSFGIVLNPVLIIPFIIAPLLNGIIAWIATSLGLVNHVVASAPWTLPGPIGAFLACGNDWRAAVLSVILILLSIAIYYPFFRMYDKKLLEEESED